jgi:prefoldin subunit 5
MEKEMTNLTIQDIEKQIDHLFAQIDALYQEREEIDEKLDGIREIIEDHASKTGREFLDYPIIKSLRNRKKEIESSIQTLNQEAIYQRLKLNLNICKEIS